MMRQLQEDVRYGLQYFKFSLQQIINQMDNASNLFLQIAHMVTGMGDLHLVIDEQEGKMELLSFHISKLSPQQAISTYRRIQKKYQHPNGVSVQPQAWLESQKRLFAWFIVFYTHLTNKHISKEHQIDFAALSPSLFHKNPHFLEFHFLTMLKASEKTNWNSEMDEFVLNAMRVQGMRWNEVSRMIFVQTNREVFLPPKSCRERWLNHLDTTKLKGCWNDAEDMAIFEHVVETSSKKWSKMVQLLGSRRSEHSIKNRFNTLIAKHRNYKSQRDLNVAERIIANLRRKMEEPCSYSEKQEQNDGGLIVAASHSDLKSNPESLKKQACQQDGISLPAEKQSPVQSASMPRGSSVVAKEEQGEGMVAMAQLVREGGMDGPYPFQNYSYEQDMYKYPPQMFDFHPAHLYFYQPVFAVALPTADTITREARLIQERRRRNTSSQ